MTTAVGQYATLAGVQARLRNTSVDDAAELQTFCDQVNAWIELTTGRVLAPLPAFHSTATGTTGQRTITLASASGLSVGDDLLVGPLSAVHEAHTIMAISADLSQPVAAWVASTAYVLTDPVQPVSANGHTYTCVVAGTTSTTEPTWPTDGSAVVDGTAVWLDAGLTSATVWLDSTLAHDYVAAVCQRIYVQDGHSALDYGRSLVVERGIIMLAALEVAPYTGGPFSVASQTDYFLRPSGPDLQPGWPFTEILWTDIPTGSAYPVFYPAYSNIRLIGPGPCVDSTMAAAPFTGWPAIPTDIVGVAERTVVGLWQMKAGGGAYSVGPATDVAQAIPHLLSLTDWKTLRTYERKTAMAV